MPPADAVSLLEQAIPPAPGHRDYRMRRFLVAADTTAMLVAIGSWLLVGVHKPLQHALWALPTIPVWLALFLMYGLYSTGLRRVAHTTVDDIPALAHAFLVGGVCTWLYFSVTPAGQLSFIDLLLFMAVGLCAALTLRSILRGLALALLGPERILFVGSGPMTPILVRQISCRPSHGLEPVGVLTRKENRRWPLALTTLGSLAAVDPATVIETERIDRVIVSAEGIDDDRLMELISTCGKLGVKVSALPSLAAMIGPAATIDQLEGITMIGINTPKLPRSSRFFKRTMDVVGASALLLLTSPLWAALAIAIKLDSRGPVFFRQERVGRGGHRFRLAKFRSMCLDAEAQREALLAQSRQAGWLDLEEDPRITRVGRWLRRTSLDELPQLLSVIRGDMSLVGPRPLIPQEDENVHGWARGRLDLTPGVTGMWQVLGRVSIPFDQMVMIDYLYVANWSLWTDIKLLLRTLPVVLSRRGAN
ncbi:MAG: sugar transferase [Actinomycetota bacterium]|nr:sugar transferase [Actinomycetota bacterium]